MNPAIALLAAREIARLLDRADPEIEKRIAPLSSSRFSGSLLKKVTVAAVVMFVLDLSFAIGLPVGRILRRKTDRQTVFVQQVAERIAKNQTLMSAPSFPATVVMVLAYRLNRTIDRASATCGGGYFYLSDLDSLPSCLAHSQSLATLKSRGKRYGLIYVPKT
jgi:hypothetical protein